MKRLITIILLLPLIWASCVIEEIVDFTDKASNISEVRWNPAIAIPLVYSNVELGDVIRDTGDFKELRIYPDGLLSLFYEDQYQSKSAEEVVMIDNQLFSETINFNALQLQQLNSSGSVSVTRNVEHAFDFGSKELDYMLLKQGQIEVTLSTSLEHEVRCLFMGDRPN